MRPDFDDGVELDPASFASIKTFLFMLALLPIAHALMHFANKRVFAVKSRSYENSRWELLLVPSGYATIICLLGLPLSFSRAVEFAFHSGWLGIFAMVGGYLLLWRLHAPMERWEAELEMEDRAWSSPDPARAATLNGNATTDEARR